MSRGSSRLSYRARKRRQRRIILVISTVLAFFLVCTGLLYMLQGSGEFNWFKKDPSSSENSTEGDDGETGAQSGDETGESGEQPEESTEESTEAPTDAPAVLTLEDIWENDPRTPVEAKAVYLSATAAARRSTLDYVIQLLDTTVINAVVIDIKDDEGFLTVDLDIPLAEEIKEIESQLTFKSADDLKAILDELKSHGAYLIARIAAFRDGVLAKADTDCSLWWKEGSPRGTGPYIDSQGYRWLDPANETVRQYLLDVSQAAVNLGFDEIQYDYIRFPTTYIGQVAHYGGTGYYLEDGVTYNLEAAAVRKEAITSFVEYACRELVPHGVFVSADVYGIIIGSEEDGGNVGQDYVELSKWLDYICPMVYPSHYTSPIYGVQYPDTNPYAIVNGAMTDSKTELSVLTDAGEHCAIVRPWMQTFTADWLGAGRYIEYAGYELSLQLDAVYDAGYDEWILWNSAGNYQKYSAGIK
ncbi:MAG: sugar fermentation stimulation protein [Lachnospiraceae bacterium]|nr:sugar fermentation stimulation protein [Lachnospiraceae bacterium]